MIHCTRARVGGETILSLFQPRQSRIHSLTGIVFSRPRWLASARGERFDAGARDASDVNKHKRDVFRLPQIAEPDTRIELPGEIESEMDRFLDSMLIEGVDLAALGIRSMGVPEAVELIRSLFRWK